MKKLTSLKMHLNEDTVGLFEPTQEGATNFGNAVKSALSGMTPIVQVTTGFLNKYNYVYVKVILQSKEKWPNGIINNASQFTMHLTADGTMEMTASHLYVKSKRPNYALDRLPIKFRKTKVKSPADAIGKMKKLINDIRAAFKAEGVSLDGTSSQSENYMKSGLKQLIKEILMEKISYNVRWADNNRNRVIVCGVGDDEVAAESAFEKFIEMQGDYDYVLPGHYDDLKDCWYFRVQN